MINPCPPRRDRRLDSDEVFTKQSLGHAIHLMSLILILTRSNIPYNGGDRHARESKFPWWIWVGNTEGRKGDRRGKRKDRPMLASALLDLRVLFCPPEILQAIRGPKGPLHRFPLGIDMEQTNRLEVLKFDPRVSGGF